MEASGTARRSPGSRLWYLKRRIVDEEAEQLGQVAAAVVRRLNLGPAFPLALAGGLFIGSESYQQRVLEALRTDQYSPAPVTIVVEPALGALRLAQQAADAKAVT
jgi:N-acetylmuramic acid 6-phosphate etherase